MCLFIWATLTKSDRLFSLDCDVQHRPEQATVFKVALPRDFPRIQGDVLSGSQKLPYFLGQEGCAGLYWH